MQRAEIVNMSIPAMEDAKYASARLPGELMCRQVMMMRRHKCGCPFKPGRVSHAGRVATRMASKEDIVPTDLIPAEIDIRGVPAQAG